MDRLAERLAAVGSVRRDEALSRHTTFGIGGPADLFVTPRGADALAATVRAAEATEAPWFVLGSGSNILVADEGIRGVVIDNRARAANADATGRTWRVESGTSFAAFARRMCRLGLGGLSWAVGIPGTFGGAVVYNAGAYGGCLADVLTRARLLDDRLRDVWVDAGDLDLVYRGSLLTREQPARRAVLEVEVALAPGDPKALLDAAGGYDERRLSAQPRGRNAGSTFKNPPGHPAWKLIESVGMRGLRRGDAAISEKHANFFVNLGIASAADVAWLVHEAERRVWEQHGIRLEREVAFVGAWP
jgi:UDP-N-acetylmuramate dehydrogenase